MSFRKWSPEDDEVIRTSYNKAGAEAVAKKLNRSVSAVRNRASDLNVSWRRKWTALEIEKLKKAYEGAATNADLRLEDLSKSLGRDKANISRKAKQLGFPVNISRKKRPFYCIKVMFDDDGERREYKSQIAKDRIRKRGHPKHMLGKSHSEDVKKRISEASRERWSSMNEDEKAAQTMLALKAKVKKYGSVNPKSTRGSWKAGWRNVGGRDVYFRSRWEANYGRYLEWLKVMGEIKEWEHEPETFWFEKIKRGVRSYLPDFKVTEKNGNTVFHEVKGWMDARSKTTLKRMKKYHPNVELIVIDERQYKSISRKVSGLIDGWE